MGEGDGALYAAISAVVIAIVGPFASNGAKRLLAGKASTDEEQAPDQVGLTEVMKAWGASAARVEQLEQVLVERDTEIRILRAQLAATVRDRQ